VLVTKNLVTSGAYQTIFLMSMLFNQTESGSNQFILSVAMAHRLKKRVSFCFLEVIESALSSADSKY
jgi:hypothetical protein